MDTAFSLKITSDINHIPEVSEKLEGTMLAGGFSGEEILDTQLAVEEAITNVIVHGYGNAGGEIRISCHVADGKVVVQISDSAPPFDPLSLPEPDLDAEVNERRIGGLGIYLLRQVMDDIAYQFLDGKNILTLTKNITKKSAE